MVSVDPSAPDVSVNPWRSRQNVIGPPMLVAIVAKTSFVKTVFANQATIATDSDVLDGSTSQNFSLAYMQHNTLLFAMKEQFSPHSRESSFRSEISVILTHPL